jgi:hypothetical protein
MDTKLVDWAGGSSLVQDIFELREVERADVGCFYNSVFIHSNPSSAIFPILNVGLHSFVKFSPLIPRQFIHPRTGGLYLAIEGVRDFKSKRIISK